MRGRFLAVAGVLLASALVMPPSMGAGCPASRTWGDRNPEILLPTQTNTYSFSLPIAQTFNVQLVPTAVGVTDLLNDTVELRITNAAGSFRSASGDFAFAVYWNDAAAGDYTMTVRGHHIGTAALEGVALMWYTLTARGTEIC